MASVHPFPARMAPDLALSSLERLKRGVVLDPMIGSGTVARAALAKGLSAIGFDLDPLAVLISKVGTTPIDDEIVEASLLRLRSAFDELQHDAFELVWIDRSPEAVKFVDFWFAEKQRESLRKYSYLLSQQDICDLSPEVRNLFCVALSKIIVTKKSAASLAQDTSHSRPHRVALDSDYDVAAGFERALKSIRKQISKIPKDTVASIERGDARDLSSLDDASIDAVLTSPPYLNAIDYMRGHRMSLVWLGYTYKELSETRSNSIGSERRPDVPFDQTIFGAVKAEMGELEDLSSRNHGMIERYVIDMYRMVAEVARVLKPDCEATFVVGNSCLKGTYVQNSGALAKAGELLGLGTPKTYERDLPAGSRYLPTPKEGALSKRMRKEVILTFTKQ